MGTTPFDGTVFHPAKPTKSHFTFMDATLVKAKRTGDSVFRPRRVLWQTVSPAASIVNPLDFWPDLRKISPDAIGTEADCIGDGSSALAAIATGTHGMPRKAHRA